MRRSYVFFITKEQTVVRIQSKRIHFGNASSRIPDGSGLNRAQPVSTGSSRRCPDLGQNTPAARIRLIEKVKSAHFREIVSCFFFLTYVDAFFCFFMRVFYSSPHSCVVAF